MTTGLQFDSSRFGVPNSEILPVDELLCNKAVSSVLVSDKSEQEEDGVVLKLYKTLDTTDCASVSAPEDILRLTEDRLKDFTDLRDDASVSSTSSEDEENSKVPSTRIYRLARDSSDEEDSSEDFSLAATPPRSLTSSSESSNEDSSEEGKPSKFKKTYVINDSDSEKEGLESDYEEKYDTVTVEESSPLDKNSLKTDLEINKEEPDISEVRVDCSSSIDLRIVSSDVKSREATPEADTGQDLQDFDISCQSESELNSDSELSNTVIITSLVSSEHQDAIESEVHFQQNVENFDSISQTSITEKSATESVIVREHTDSISSDSCASTTELVQDVISEANDPKLSPTSDLVSEVQEDKPNIEAKNNVRNNNHSNSDVIDSIITYSYVEILQVLSEFLNAERCLYEISEKAVKNCKAVEVEVGPETRSNTSDEFSGTESMEMPLEDSLECSGEAGQVRPGGELSGTVVGESWKETGRYTSLVMITQELGGPEEPPSSPPQEHNDEVTVVTGANTLSAVVCLEEGLADDDSWVEELDRDEIATTTEESSEEEIFPDREEELRGFHKTSIDFTLHTIVEESCEESEVEVERTHPTELEKYFVYGIGESLGDEERETDTLSETSSIYSEGVESVGGAEQQSDNNGDPADLASSRLEKYFLNGFKDFHPRDSDGSVGSDSEGKPSPEQRRKRLVRARGTARQHSNSLDNLTESEQQLEVQLESEDSSTETDSHDDQSNSFEKNDGQFDTVKRTKKKKRSVSSAPSMELLETPEDCMSGSKEDLNSDEGKKTPQPEYLFSTDLVRNKQQSRDSGFVGSCDDLLKESRESQGTEVSKTEDEANIKIEPAKIVPELTVSSPPTTALTRKDSFNNWSSDEETNLMMSKMRAFFKTMVGSQCKGSSPNVKPKTKPPQLLYFETELTRLMKTVPGLKDEQVKEIVEYLSSEDTWSDSYDSSDYTSSDLESGNKKSALQEEISASCRQIISNFESSNIVDEPLLRNGAENKDSVYQRIVASFSKIETPAANSSAPQNSPPLMEKVMQHIGTRLVALMHEVSSGEGASPRVAKHHRRLQSKLSATSTTEEEEDSTEDFSPLPRSKSHDPLLEENKQEASDNERFSWRGSFESALMASDSRTRLASGGEGSASALALAAKRRSAGDLMFKSREELDRVRSWGSMVSGSAEDKIWSQQRAQRRRRRSSESGGSADGDDDSEEEEAGETGGRATLPRLQPSSVGAATNSLPRLPTSPPAPTIYKAHSVNNVKSARYRPPGYRNSGGALAPRRDQRRRPTPSPAQPLSHPHGKSSTHIPILSYRMVRVSL
jgi:synaptotagmin-like protein